MKQTFTFNAIPAALDEFKALPEAALQSPFQTVALTLLALCRYRDDRERPLRRRQKRMNSAMKRWSPDA